MSAIKKKQSSIASPDSPVATSLPVAEILTAEQAAALLQVDPKTLYSWTRRRSKLAQPIPFRHLGKFIRFEKSELLQWFLSLGSETKVGRPFGISQKGAA